MKPAADTIVSRSAAASGADTRRLWPAAEKLSIEAALRRVDDNQASAAEMPGVGRQSLYDTMRRDGLFIGSTDEAGDDDQG